MITKGWSKESDYYELEDGFYLERAEYKEFSRYYGVYFYEDLGFKTSFEKKCEVISEKDTCFWIKKDASRIGGVLMEENYTEGLFLIPPFNDPYKVIKMLKEVQLYIANKDKNIKAYITPLYLEHYERLGFRIEEIGRWMIRPTEAFEVQWGEKYRIENPKEDDTESIAKLFVEAFKNDIGVNSTFSLETRISFIKDYFKDNGDIEILKRASTLIYDKKTSELIGACLISEFKGWPLISDVAVMPLYNGRGIGTKMIKKALTVLNESYPVLRLYVTIGNNAESVYYNLGFLPGIQVASLYIPSNIV